MRKIHRNVVLLLAGILLFTLLGYSQDEPSLGDVARQARQQKQQNKDAQSKDPQSKATATSKTPKVITNEEIPEHPEESPAAADSPVSGPALPTGKVSGEQWKSKIQAQKNAVNTLQNQIDKLNSSIQFAPGNCVSGCVQWNELQVRKQEEVDRMRSQLAQQKKRLEDMQESARRQGYGSSVYDP